MVSSALLLVCALGCAVFAHGIKMDHECGWFDSDCYVFDGPMRADNLVCYSERGHPCVQEPLPLGDPQPVCFIFRMDKDATRATITLSPGTGCRVMPSGHFHILYISGGNNMVVQPK